MISWMNIFTVGRAWNNWRVLNWGQLCNNSSDIWCALLSQQSTPTALSTVLSQLLLWHIHSALTLTAQHSPQQLLWHKMQSAPLSQHSLICTTQPRQFLQMVLWVLNISFSTKIYGNPRKSKKVKPEALLRGDCHRRLWKSYQTIVCFRFAMFSILGLVKSQQTMAFFDTLRVGGSRADTTLREKNCVSFH